MKRAAVTIILVLCFCLSGCSGIDKAEWDALKDTQKVTLVKLEKAEVERTAAIDLSVKLRDRLAKIQSSLLKLREWVRRKVAEGGGILPW